MKKIIILFFISLSLPLLANNGLSGDWTGRLQLDGNRSLKLVLHISEDDASVTMDSPDQGVNGITAYTVYLKGDSLNFRVPQLMMGYTGSIRDGVLSGTFRQGVMKIPLAFERGAKKVVRPQTPVPPYPYTCEEVTIENTEGKSTLAGTLCIPEGATATTPVVVLVSGSGVQNRDEELFEHKPFAVIADYLARHGIASLRYDDRGFGESKGDVLSATTADFASDTKAVTDWLRKSGRFGKTGILGHSEGGIIAYMLGASAEAPDFIISIAGPSVKGTKTIAFQNKVALLKTGATETEAEDFSNAIERALELKIANPGITEFTDEEVAEIYPQWNESENTRTLAASIKSAMTSKADNEWMMYFLNHDPAKNLRALHIPAFIIYGEKDRQVPPSLNLEMAEKLAPDAIVKCYHGLNHLMQHANSGDVEEYSSIEETFAPEVLADITAFINNHGR